MCSMTGGSSTRGDEAAPPSARWRSVWVKLNGLEPRVPKVSAELVDLLQALFQQDEFSRALEREDWSVELVKHLSPVEHTTPDAWFHGVVRLVVQRDEVPELLALARRLRPKRSAEIDAVERLLSSTAGATPAKVAAPSVKVTPVSTRPAPQGWRPVRVLHLSDLHFSAKTAWDSGTVLGRLAADVASLRAELGEIHLVVVTGDIANHGTAEEYERATAWLTKQLAQAAGVSTAQIRVVPGNHDVHRASISRTARMVADGLLRDPDPQQAIAEVLSDPNERAPLLARQTAYLSFAQTFHPGLTAPWWSERLPDLAGLTVHLAGFNSAWLSADDTDLGRLLVSRWQCHQLLAGAEGADLSIALLHHPWSYLQEQDQGVVEEEIRRRCGVILNGHLHQQKARITSDPDRDVLQLAAGASYAGSKWANAYQLLELDPKRGEARVHFRLWDGFDWIPDRNRYQKAPDGVATLPLRRSPKAPKPPPEDDPTEDIAEAPDTARTPHARLRTLCRRVFDKLPSILQLGRGAIANVSVHIEVTLTTSEDKADRGFDAAHGLDRKTRLKLLTGVDRLEGRIPLTRVLDHSHRRWGLLGDPGSGKTTLLRHIADELLCEPNGPLPIYLKVAELEHGLSTAIAAQCAFLNAPDLVDFMLTEVRAGRAALLLDGLEEAADLSAAQRWVVGAAVEAGNSLVIVASSPESYTKPLLGFQTLTICPLGPEQQSDLLARWCNDRAKIQSILERLSQTMHLRRFAESPLLLNLVGLLLRAGYDVPGRQCNLYKCVLKVPFTGARAIEGDTPVSPMRNLDLTVELLGWAALRLNGLEGQAYRLEALIAALESDPQNAAQLRRHWSSPVAFIAEVAEHTGLLIPDTGRVHDATAYSFPHRTFREFLAATALARDLSTVTTRASKSHAGELSRVLIEGEARPERWARVLALTCDLLTPGGADGLLRRIMQTANSALLLGVVAEADSLSTDTVRGMLRLEEGWSTPQLQARQKVIERIPALVEDPVGAVALLEHIGKSTTCGHDLFWVREVLRRIERGEVAGGVPECTLKDAKRAAKAAADKVLSHLSLEKRAALMTLLKPWWRPIPAGSFDMGGDEHDREKPIHRVTFTSGFHMLGVPVTWAMYRLFDPGHDAARSNFRGQLPPEAQDEVPVYRVSWYAAMMFAEWVGARLPLEPEWEYACRAGTTTRFWIGDTEEDLARVGWHGDKQGGGNAQGHPHPVARKSQNAWGLQDVHGNVWEWCIDEAYDYNDRADGITLDSLRLILTVGDGLLVSAGQNELSSSHVQRGGSWYHSAGEARAAYRRRNWPSTSETGVGFRLVMIHPERL